MSALGVFAAVVMGLPLTLVLTPLFYAGTLLIAEVINHYSPLPPEFWQNVNDLGQLTVRVGDFIFNHRGTLYANDVMWGAAFLLLPGMLVAFLLWVSVMVLFRRGGVGGALASLGAREPNAQDLKELQLADVAQEMAIAAGLPAPKVMLLDSQGANAAAIGTSAKDARIVLSRRLLDDLDRDQLQALLGHLVGSIGNGDLRIAFTVTSVFESCGLLVTMINSPFGKQSRSALWRMLRYTFSRGGDAAREAEADTVAGLLAGTLDINQTDIDQFFNSAKHAGPIRKLLRLIFFPVVFTNIAVEITLWFFLNLLLGPAMALVWRTRRYLADASAVELTRNPEALASALDRLARDNTAVEGGAWATHLFVINPQGDSSARASGPNLEEMRQAAQLWAASGGGAAAANPSQLSMAEFARLRSQMISTGFAAARGDQAAAARMEAFMVAVQKAQGQEVTFHAKDLADVAGAMKGDPAAMARLRTLSQHRQAQRPAKQGSTGLQTQSFLSFHPPLKKRLRRLERMGAQYRAQAHAHMGAGARIFAGVLFLIIGPLMAVAFAGMVVVIAMMIMLNLVVLSIWMVAIHAIFVWWNGA